MSPDEKLLVFVGPTLESSEVLSLRPDALICPPIKMGDLSMLLKVSPGMILILDGYYEFTPSVWHKEILSAISHGWIVLGASSMGALRAAELSDLGMIGFGEIFDKYKSGVFEDDDDVAVLHQHQQFGFKAVTEAQVNVFFTLQDWLSKGIISKTSFEVTLALSKLIPYKYRTWELIHERLVASRGGDISDVLHAIKSESKINQKKRDASEALKNIELLCSKYKPASDQQKHSNIWMKEVGSRALSRPLLIHEQLSDRSDKLGSLLRFDSKVFIACGELAKLMALSAAISAQKGEIDGTLQERGPTGDKSRYFRILFRLLVMSSSASAVWNQSLHAELLHLAEYASSMWEPIELRYKALGIYPNKRALQTYAEEIVEVLSLTSQDAMASWLNEHQLNPTDFLSVVEFLYLYREVITYWNIHYLGVQDVDLARNWWREAFLAMERLTGFSPTSSWARQSYMDQWKTELTDLSYIRLGFSGGCEEFHAAVNSLDWGEA